MPNLMPNIWQRGIHVLSRLLGWLLTRQTRWFKNLLITWFVNHYRVDLSEAQYDDINAYRHFNDFFTRQLRPDARPLDDAPLVSPVDARVSQVDSLRDNRMIQAKRHQFTIEALLNDKTQAQQFIDGFFWTLYLAPRNYHRVHIPCDATLIGMTYLPGSLHSVNEKSVATTANLFAQNTRVVCYFDTDKFGIIALVLVGARFVGAISVNWQTDIARFKRIERDYQNQRMAFRQGDEIGCFNMGSTVIFVVNAQARELLRSTIHQQQSIAMGEALAQLK